MPRRSPRWPRPTASSAGAPTWTRRWPTRDDTVFFDAGTTQMRPTLLAKAIRAGKHVYCEKPIATNLNEAVEIARAGAGVGPEARRGAGQAVPARPAQARHAAPRRLLRPHAVGAAGVRLLGVRGRPAADPAPELELPQGRRRRHDPGHDVPLALRAGQPVRRGEVGLVHGRDAHSRSAGTKSGSPTRPPPTTPPMPRPNWSATTASR